jgi:hypothetical protein
MASAQFFSGPAPFCRKDTNYVTHQPDASRLAAIFQQLSQAQLTEALGIPQRTLSFYKREPGDIPAGRAPTMCWVFRWMNCQARRRKKTRRRGPTGEMHRLFEAAPKLPRPQ